MRGKATTIGNVSSELGRRSALKKIALAGVLPAALNSHARHGKKATNADAPGTTEWEPTNPARQREIEGYASARSVDLGDTIRFFVSTADPSFTIELFRLGWYGGAGGTRVSQPVTLAGVLQPTPAADPLTGLIECNWKASYEIKAAKQPGFSQHWTSGIYLAKLTGSSGKQRYIRFVVRDDDREPDLLFQSSVTTDLAYNNWPSLEPYASTSVGKSLYEFNSSGGVRARKVSFNRPNNEGLGAGTLFRWEYQMLRFLEREGYDVAYCTNLTAHVQPDAVQRCRAYLSVGHDEYWSNEMRSAITKARDRGTHLGFFSANNCYWRVRFEPSAITGGSTHTMVCYKGDGADPYLRDADRATVRWRDAPIGRPEDALVGVMYFLDPVDGDLVVDDPSHWVFADTGLKKGDKLPGLLGYEVDRIFGNAPSNLVRLCHSPAINQLTGQLVDYADMTIYKASSGARVFATGTIQWSWGLDSYGVVPLPGGGSRLNAAAQQITRNVLARFIDD